MEENDMKGLILVLVYALIVGFIDTMKGKNKDKVYVTMFFAMACGCLAVMMLNKLIQSQETCVAIYIVLSQIGMSMIDKLIKMYI